MPPNRVRLLQERIPNLRVSLLGPGKHHFHEDYAEEITDAISDAS